MRKSVFFFVLSLILNAAPLSAQLDSVRARLAHAPVQEKVYLHIDNNCYFKGDTIWYKSYVVKADSLTFTDMSRILYVELVSPDGLLVERQNIILSADGFGDGNFVLKDSLYSGYYELRAYTRWMLNFCVTEHPYTYTDREQFYNRQMAKDFFRQYGTVYSRVVPVYERPETPGDYGQKYIVSRPKQRLDKELKEKLTVNFYPEGGHLIAGTRCAVAFEALSEEGEQVDIGGTVEVGGTTVNIATQHQGRGLFVVDVPENGRMKAHFSYRGKDYSFDLPKTEQRGCALHVDAVGEQLAADIQFRGMGSGRDYGVAVLCRGVLKSFQTIKGNQRLLLQKDSLPTGVCDLIVIDELGTPMADRLFFVKRHDHEPQTISLQSMDTDYQPFSPITLDFQAPAGTKVFSLSVRDGSTDDPTYDTGNIMTDLLLSSDLKGFVAYPDYYFEADDAQHRQHLDLLMMVQGWRRYDYEELTDTKALRYQPEQTMTVEGAVYNTVSFDEIREGEMGYWLQGIFGYTDDDVNLMDPNDPLYQKYEKALEAETPEDENRALDDLTSYSPYKDRVTGKAGEVSVSELSDMLSTGNAKSADDPEYGINHGGLRHEVTLKGELVLSDEVATIEMETHDGGRFAFEVPPYYGDAILFLSAHKTDISDRKLHRLETKGILNEDEWPEYYVKRDLFYPIFARKYDYYQCHLPSLSSTISPLKAQISAIDIDHLSTMDRELGEVNVKARRRRGRQAIDYTKPAYVYDTYELYNLATDYGLSFGKLNFRRFPVQVSMLLLGNYNSNRFFNVQARMSDNLQSPYVFFRNYAPDISVNTDSYRSNNYVYSNLRMNRQDELHLFTDFELRNEDKPIEQATTVADVTLDFVLMDDEAKRYTYRDRRIILHGMYEPAEFYHRDYSTLPEGTATADIKDYRRTLYWNPNAKVDEEGRFTARFYNNAKPTRIKVSVAGLTDDGQPVALGK
jgi:hypothetical protein